MFVEHGLHEKGEKWTVQLKNSHKSKLEIQNKVLFKENEHRKIATKNKK